MKVAVVGAGAMGSLFGGLLCRSCPQVWLLDVWEEHVRQIQREGLCIEGEGFRERVRVNATTDPAEVGQVDLAIVFVKSMHTPSAAKTLSEILARDGVAVTLQNGLGNAEELARHIGPQRVLAGTTSHGATLLGPGRIRHAGRGPTRIGMWGNGSMEVAMRIRELFNASGIETEIVEDVKEAIWDKLLVNVGINAITALTGIKNGQLLDLDITRELVRRAVAEAVAVARAQGITVRDNVVEHVFEVARATASNRSSMGQDVDKGRPTEIGAINEAVWREGERAGLEAPINFTLTALVRTLEAHFHKRG